MTKRSCAPVDEHQVIDDAAFVIEQQAVALLAGLQADHVHGNQGLERGCGVSTHQAQLAHVRDVEQAGGGAGVVVFGHQAGRVLHRHRIAGKRHHAGTEFHMCSAFSGVVSKGVSWGADMQFSCGANSKHGTHAMGCPRCPLYLRDSPGLRHRAWGTAAGCGLLLRWTPPACTRGDSLQ
jgi:hypothetical protein